MFTSPARIIVALAATAVLGGTIGYGAADGQPYRVPVIPGVCKDALLAADDAIADGGKAPGPYVEQRDRCRDIGGAR